MNVKQTSLIEVRLKCLQEVLEHVDPQNTTRRTHFKAQEYLHI